MNRKPCAAKRLSLLLLACWLAAGTSAYAATLLGRNEAEYQTSRCGEYEIRIRLDDPVLHDMPPRHAELRLLDSVGRTVYRIHADSVEVRECVPEAGDGSPAALLLLRGGGKANSRYRLLSLEGRARLLLDFEAGPREVSTSLHFLPDGRLVGEDDRLRAFAGLAAASAPMIPVAFCYEPARRRYRDCSGELLAKDALLERLGFDVEALAGETDESRRRAEAVRIMSLAARDGESALVLAWMRETAPDMAKWLSPRIRRLEYCLSQSATASRSVRLRACR